MTVNYQHHNGQQVLVTANGKHGEITAMVPGDGKDPWYFVAYNDGSGEDRWQAQDLEAA